MDSPAFSPIQIGSLRLRNRVVRSGCFEGLCQDGLVTSRLVEHHRQVARGGVGMTTVAYASVSYDGRAFGHELWMREEIVSGLAQLVEAVHQEGAAASIQLGHCGFFASPDVIGQRPMVASPQFCTYRLSFCREMTRQDMQTKIEDFRQAAQMARQAGFDAIEIHAGHGYLLSQFLSPWTNHRRDEYGGSLENRLRFPLAVLRAVRAALGPDFPILVKMNSSDGMRDGVELHESVQIARCFAEAGASALVPSCGFTAKTPLYMMRGNVPTFEMAREQDGWLQKVGLVLFGRLMVQTYPFERLFLLDGARSIKNAVHIPVGYIGGVLGLEDIEQVLAEGFAFVEVGRATVRDPDFVNHLRRGEIQRSDCDHCNRCIASMSVNGINCISKELGLLV